MQRNSCVLRSVVGRKQTKFCDYHFLTAPNEIPDFPPKFPFVWGATLPRAYCLVVDSLPPVRRGRCHRRLSVFKSRTWCKFMQCSLVQSTNKVKNFEVTNRGQFLSVLAWKNLPCFFHSGWLRLRKCRESSLPSSRWPRRQTKPRTWPLESDWSVRTLRVMMKVDLLLALASHQLEPFVTNFYSPTYTSSSDSLFNSLNALRKVSFGNWNGVAGTINIFQSFS